MQLNLPHKHRNLLLLSACLQQQRLADGVCVCVCVCVCGVHCQQQAFSTRLLQETQSKPEGQVHFFPILFNGKKMYETMVERCGPSQNSLPRSTEPVES